jgi:hypothetical protein
VFYTKQNGEPEAQDGFFVRARNAGTAYAPTMQAAALNAQVAAQTAAQGMGRQMRQGTYTARGWAAPRLESAADYYMATLAPRIAEALRSTARQVRPEEVKKSRRPTVRSALSTSMLALAVLAAGGAVAALVRRQYKTAMEADAEGDVVDIGDANEPTTATAVPGQSPAPGEATTPKASKAGADSGTTTGKKPSSEW